MGELQGLGRHRPVPGLRAGAGTLAVALPGRGTILNNALTETLRERLAPLAPTLVDIHDDSAEHAGHAGASAGGGHFSLVIVSKAFSGQSRLARHRAVLDRVGDLIPHPVHALAIQAYAPDEFPSNS